MIKEYDKEAYSVIQLEKQCFEIVNNLLKETKVFEAQQLARIADLASEAKYKDQQFWETLWDIALYSTHYEGP